MAQIAPRLTVYFDGSCPLCRREIAFYRRRGGAETIDWVDLSKPEPEVQMPPGLTCAQAMARFHVRTCGGKLVSGGQAFALLWTELDGFQLLGRVGLWPPMSRFLDWCYDLFLPIRPKLQSLLPTAKSN